jgi:hypothetical protein
VGNGVVWNQGGYVGTAALGCSVEQSSTGRLLRSLRRWNRDARRSEDRDGGRPARAMSARNYVLAEAPSHWFCPSAHFSRRPRHAERMKNQGISRRHCGGIHHQAVGVRDSRFSRRAPRCVLENALATLTCGAGIALIGSVSICVVHRSRSFYLS